MTTPKVLFSLTEAIAKINSKINEEPTPQADGEYQDLIQQLESSFRKYFPNGYFSANHSKRFGNSISISVGLIKDLKDVSSSIRQNDPMHTIIFIHINEAAGTFEVKSSSSGLSVNPEAGSYMAIGTVKNPVRKFTTDNPSLIVKKLDQYFAKCKEIVKANWDNIYQVGRINPMYMVEEIDGNRINEEQHYSDLILNELVYNSGWDEVDNSSPRTLTKEYRIMKAEDRSGQYKKDVNVLTVEVSFDPEYGDRYLVITTGAGEFEIGDIDGRETNKAKVGAIIDAKVKAYILKHFKGSDIQESSSNEIQISGQDLLQASTAISKYPNDIRLKVIGKNKFSLTLSNKKLLDTDKAIAKLFSSLKEGFIINEEDREVFKNENGKVIASIKDGKEMFIAYDKAGKIIGKPAISKTIAVTSLNKAKIQESEEIRVSPNGSEFFELLNSIEGEFTESNPLKLGNIEFWKEDGGWIWDLPVSQWAKESLIKDLTKRLEK